MYNSPVVNRYFFLSRTADVLTFLQPVLLATAYSSIIAGMPPVWLAWTLFLLSLLPAFLVNKLTGLRTSFDIPLALFTIGLSISFIFTPHREISVVTYQTYLLCLVSYYGILVNGLRRVWYWKLVITVIGILVIALVTAAFAQDSPATRVLPYNRWLYDAASILPINIEYYISVNAVGTALGTTAPGIIAYSVFTQSHRGKAVSLALGIIALALVILTASTSGLIAALAGLALILCLRKPWTIALSSALGVAWVLLTLTLDNQQLPGPVSWLIPHSTLIERTNLWKDSLVILSERLATGVGPGAWFLIYNQRHPEFFAVNPHNDLITVLSDAGILGLVGVIIAAITVIAITKQLNNYHGENRIKKEWQGLGLATVTSLVSLAANGLFETTLTGALPQLPVENVANCDRFVFVAVPLAWALTAILNLAWTRFSREND